jgi:GTP-binding protein
MTKHRRPVPERFAPGGTTGLPLVAIVGRPNVGKSTLFNRLARRRLAIVHDEPGVTRDRHYANTTALGKDFTLIDTGGFDPEDEDPMKAGIAEHVKEAIAEADVIVFVSDGSVELTGADRAAIELLRRTDKPVIYCANKVDSPKVEAMAWDLYRYGVDKIIPVSSLHGRGITELESEIIEVLPEPVALSMRMGADVPRVAVVGRPNAGKSSLLNKLLGESRMLVDSRPGTTRDAIDALVERDGRRFVFIDTAGIRKKGKVTKADDDVEAASVMHSVRSIEKSHVTVLVVDAKEGVAEQDAKILGLADDRGRAMIIALNKTDMLDRVETERAIEAARDKISFAPFVPVVTISAKTGRGINELMETVDTLYAAYKKRVGTGELNRFFEQVIDTRSPPTSGGKAPRLYFITQAETAPPTFVIIASAPDAVHFSYRRYVANQLRKHFGFEGVPIKVVYKEKRRGRRSKGEGPSDEDE